MTDDIEYRDDSWPKTMRGHADVREFLDAIWRATPDMTFELLAGPYVIPGEPRAAFHWRGWGTHTGRLDPPGFAPTHRRWELDGVDFDEYRDERVCKLRIAFDMMSASRQLGLMPDAGSRAERGLATAQRAVSGVRRAIRGTPRLSSRGAVRDKYHHHNRLAAVLSFENRWLAPAGSPQARDATGCSRAVTRRAAACDVARGGGCSTEPPPDAGYVRHPLVEARPGPEPFVARPSLRHGPALRSRAPARAQAGWGRAQLDRGVTTMTGRPKRSSTSPVRSERVSAPARTIRLVSKNPKCVGDRLKRVAFGLEDAWQCLQQAVSAGCPSLSR